MHCILFDLRRKITKLSARLESPVLLAHEVVDWPLMSWLQQLNRSVSRCFNVKRTTLRQWKWMKCRVWGERAGNCRKWVLCTCAADNDITNRNWTLRFLSGRSLERTCKLASDCCAVTLSIIIRFSHVVHSEFASQRIINPSRGWS